MNFPILGCKLSLISNAEIRYEGVLYTIDTKESTVALAKVRSFGTEDRATDHPVFPQNEIYEFIIFRATDIKDLQVIETPRPEAAAYFPSFADFQRDYLYDPFLGSLDHAYTHSSAFSMPSLAPLMPSLMTPLMPSPMAPQMPPLMPTSLPRPICPPTHDTVQSDKGSFWTSSSESLPRTPTPNHHNGSPQPIFSILPSNYASHDNYSNGFQMPLSLYQKKSQSAQNVGTQIAPPSQPPRRNTRQSQTQGNAGNWKSGNKSYAANRSRGGDKLKFSSEYDFEQANAEFQELEVKMAKTRLSDEDKETSAVNNKEEAAKKASENSPRSTCDSTDEDQHLYYDKKKSFFDTISCESTERMKDNRPRHDWSHERKINVETFGEGACSKRGGWNFHGSFSSRRNYGYSGWRGGDFRRRDGFTNRLGNNFHNENTDYSGNSGQGGNIGRNANVGFGGNAKYGEKSLNGGSSWRGGNVNHDGKTGQGGKDDADENINGGNSGRGRNSAYVGYSGQGRANLDGWQTNERKGNWEHPRYSQRRGAPVQMPKTQNENFNLVKKE